MQLAMAMKDIISIYTLFLARQKKIQNVQKIIDLGVIYYTMSIILMKGYKSWKT